MDRVSNRKPLAASASVVRLVLYELDGSSQPERTCRSAATSYLLGLALREGRLTPFFGRLGVADVAQRSSDAANLLPEFLAAWFGLQALVFEFLYEPISKYE